MDDCGLFNSVLNPGERLVWSYQRQPTASNRLMPYVIVGSGLWLISFMLLRDISRERPEPMPDWLRMELYCVAGFFFVLPALLYWLIPRLARNNAYALTDRRVLMAVGTRPEDIRAVALTALGHVWIAGRHELRLSMRYPEQKLVWTCPDTGKADKWAPPYWRVDNPTSVQELLENARNAVWYPLQDQSD